MLYSTNVYAHLYMKKKLFQLMKLNNAQLIWKRIKPFRLENEFQLEGHGALTLYGDAIHRPGDGGLGRATGPAGQHTVLSWS